MPATTGTAARTAPASIEATAASPLGFLAVRLLALAREAGRRGLVHVAGSERRAEHLGRILHGLAGDLDVLVFPPWDCLPYDRAPPSREVMGRRVGVLRRLAASGDGPCLVLMTPDALLQRVPPRRTWAGACLRLASGGKLAVDRLEAFLRRAGYVLDERVDEAGEAAIRGHVIDVFPAGAAMPCRVEHDDARIVAIRIYDPVTQRTVSEVETLELEPASELVLPEGAPEPERFPGMEHWLPDFHPRLETLFDYLAEAPLVVEPKADERVAAALEQIADAHRARADSRPEPGAAARPPPSPERLYLDAAEWRERLRRRRVIRLAPGDGDRAPGAAPRFVEAADAGRAFASFVATALGQGRRVVLAAPGERDRRNLARRIEHRIGRAPEPADGWDAVRQAPEGALLTLRLDLEAGFVDQADGVAVVAAADLLGSRAESGAEPAPSPLLVGTADFHIGDAVIHVDHGMGALRGIETIAAEGAGEGDVIRLEYAGEDKLMVPAMEMGRIWRYGADAEAVALDRLEGGSWAKRRARIEAELAETATRLTRMAEARQAARTEPIVPPRRDYERFVARFPFSETADQARAIDETLRDLASGRPMDRLVCGDVGFGKTEVALRAAAAAAFAGRQVAIVAPTTVLVRQHWQTLRRRFAGFGIAIGQLSRLAGAAETAATRRGLADGSIRIVVGTHAVAGKHVAFKDLGLVVIDEEQRFGAAHKARLRTLAGASNVLTLTATPIPRTLQGALVGLNDVSIIATPPARRQPVRTFLTPFDQVVMREALVREDRRGGQSFVVCPRIEDIAPMAARLAEAVPDLQVLVAHGRMPAAAIDDTMVRFADGDGDVLLATNIIESGLDVPRANTMLVWRADRFGLAQLHQLRGRVGRGRARGICYLLTDPASAIAEATLKRLNTLAALDRLGAGFAISARDLDLRGAGDLLGDEQAGHARLVGVGLYQHLLSRALLAARGQASEEDWSPELNLGLSGHVPHDYVPEPEVRINLYARLARPDGTDDVDALTAEIEDRFGPMPDAVRRLVDLVRVKRLCRRLGVARIDAGPRAVALTFRPATAGGPAASRIPDAEEDDLAWHGERLVLGRASTTDEERLQLVLALLDRLDEA